MRYRLLVFVLFSAFQFLQTEPASAQKIVWPKDDGIVLDVAEIYGKKSTEPTEAEMLARAYASNRGLWGINHEERTKLFKGKRKYLKTVVDEYFNEELNEYRSGRGFVACQFISRIAWDKDLTEKDLVDCKADKLLEALFKGNRKDIFSAHEAYDRMYQPGIERFEAFTDIYYEGFKNAKPELLTMFAMYVLKRNAPKELQEKRWHAIEKRYMEAIKRVASGQAEIVRSAAFGVGSVNADIEFRSDTVRYIGREPSETTSALLLRIMRIETEFAVLDRLPDALENLDPKLETSRECIDIALGMDNSAIRRTAIELLDSSGLEAEYKTELVELAKDQFRGVRIAARELLEKMAVELPQVPATVISDETRKAFVDICTKAMVDPNGAIRVRATSNIMSCWGRFGERKNSPGWLLAGPDGETFIFIDDEMNRTVGTKKELAVREVDFKKELEAAATVKDEESNELHAGVRGTPAHRYLLLAYGITLMKKDKTLENAVLRLFEVCRQNWVSESALIRSTVSNVAWLRFDKTVNSHGQFEDVAAITHASRLISLESFSKPQTYLAGWIRVAKRIIYDSTRRISKGAVKKPKLYSLDYCIGNLDEIVIRQYGQPGGADFSGASKIPARLKEIGRPAILPLLDKLESTELIRGCSFWRDFSRSRSIYTTGNAASWLLREIIDNELEVRDVDNEIFQLEHRDALRAWIVNRLKQ